MSRAYIVESVISASSSVPTDDGLNTRNLKSI